MAPIWAGLAVRGLVCQRGKLKLSSYVHRSCALQPTHSSSEQQNPPKISSLRDEFQNFSKQVPANSHNFRFRSLLFNLYSKFVKTVAGISVMSQFHRFFDLISAGF
jgi:hypothetical protein